MKEGTKNNIYASIISSIIYIVVILIITTAWYLMNFSYKSVVKSSLTTQRTIQCMDFRDQEVYIYNESNIISYENHYGGTTYTVTDSKGKIRIVSDVMMPMVKCEVIE